MKDFVAAVAMVFTLMVAGVALSHAMIWVWFG